MWQNADFLGGRYDTFEHHGELQYQGVLLRYLHVELHLERHRELAPELRFGKGCEILASTPGYGDAYFFVRKAADSSCSAQAADPEYRPGYPSQLVATTIQLVLLRLRSSPVSQRCRQ